MPPRTAQCPPQFAVLNTGVQGYGAPGVLSAAVREQMTQVAKEACYTTQEMLLMVGTLLRRAPLAGAAWGDFENRNWYIDNDDSNSGSDPHARVHSRQDIPLDEMHEVAIFDTYKQALSDMKDIAQSALAALHDNWEISHITIIVQVPPFEAWRFNGNQHQFVLRPSMHDAQEWVFSDVQIAPDRMPLP